MLNLNLNTNGGGDVGYVDTIIRLNTDQPDTVQLSTDINVSASIGETKTVSFVSTASAQPLGRLTGRMNSQYEVVVSGSGDWSAIEQEIDFTPTETASLVTLGLEVPKFNINVSSKTTGSISASFEVTRPYRRFNVNQSVVVENPDLFIEYFAVGGGAGPTSGANFGGGGGGKYVTGSVKLKMNNTATVSAIVGPAGGTGQNGGSTSVTFIDDEGNNTNIFVSGGLVNATPWTGAGAEQQCGAPGILWLNDLPIGWDGNAAGTPGSGKPQCPPIPTSSLIPDGGQNGISPVPLWGNHPGKGGPNQRGGAFGFRFYNPKSLITFDKRNVYTFTSGVYQYVLMAPGVTSITFTFPDQEYPKILENEVVDFISATGIDDGNTINALNNFVTELKEYDLWDKLDVIYPFVGNSETTMKYNLKDARDTDDANRITFSGNWTFSTGSGIVPEPLLNLATSANTHYVRSGNINDISMCYWTTIAKQLDATNLFSIGAVDGGSQYAVGLNGPSARLSVKMGAGSTTTTTGLPTTGMVVGQRSSNTSYEGYIDGSLRTSGTSAGNLTGWPTGVSVNLSLGGLNAQNMIFAHIGKSLTARENADLYAIVRNLQKTLGRI